MSQILMILQRIAKVRRSSVNALKSEGRMQRRLSGMRRASTHMLFAENAEYPSTAPVEASR